MSNIYEGLFIIKPELNEDEAKGAYKAILELVAKNGGSLKKEEMWGKRPLAYPVKKAKEAYYYKLDFEAPAESIAKLEAAYKLNPSILRTLITRR